MTKEGIKRSDDEPDGKGSSHFATFDYIRFNGGSGGYLHDLTLTGLFHTGAGMVKTDDDEH